MTDDELHELDAAYALDALDDDERAAFEAHLPTCDRCTASVAELRETAARLAETTTEVPPADLRASIMDEIATTPQVDAATPASTPVVDLATARTRRRPSAAVFGALSVAAAAIVVLGAVLLTRGTERSVDDVIAAPDAIVTPLDGERGELRIAWSRELDEVAVIGDDLAPITDAETYQLWFLLDEGVESAGLFRPDGAGSIAAILEVADADGAGWGVTIEPAAGSTQPTGDILFSGFIG